MEKKSVILNMFGLVGYGLGSRRPKSDRKKSVIFNMLRLVGYGLGSRCPKRDIVEQEAVWSSLGDPSRLQGRHQPVAFRSQRCRHSKYSTNFLLGS